MGRLAREIILYDGCFAHIFSRSFEGRKIFEKEDDFNCFINLLLRAKKEFGFKIFHYCLMNTHFHLVVGIGTLEQFSKAVQVIKRQYAVWFNFQHKRFGPLWRERFRSMVIENEQYLYACGLYVEQNPVKAGMVKESQEWVYSSSRFYQEGKHDPLVDNYDLPGLPEGIELDDEDEFEIGPGIGSSLFKLYLKDQRMATCPR